MHARRPFSRWALWAFAAALLLKSAMPWLASASAGLQGKPLVEVCTVYGVSLVPLGEHGHPAAPDHAGEHGDEHCALTALAAFATHEPSPPIPFPATVRDTGPPPAAHPTPTLDATARWVARLKHGPPTPA